MKYDFSIRGKEVFYKNFYAAIDELYSEKSDMGLKYKCLVSLVEQTRLYEGNRKIYFQQIETVKNLKIDYFKLKIKLGKNYLNGEKDLKEIVEELENRINKNEIFLKKLSKDFEKDLKGSMEKDERIYFLKSFFEMPNLN